ncbi:MAG TPA: tRNA uridine-5-carboxymethylaminomethyl(34) synthesis GTPase MnmE [Clostridia bacterium]|nr:tRNA uridine-5-carboxymethylaminomethyl(34) synthesis GTPase MnmE [Clostridia bacterium]
METIAAIATPVAAGGIGIVRISGENAFEIAQKIFRSKNSKEIVEMKPYTAAYGKIIDGEKEIDEGIALVFHAPKSYTGENVVELSCHGGIMVMRMVLKAAILAGARLAEPGEFTKRAFLNGKLDLTKAESVMDLINAQSKMAVNAARMQHEGALFSSIMLIKSHLIEISSDISAWMDFPDDEMEGLQEDNLKSSIKQIADKMKRLIATYETGKMIREGIDTVITGSPNVGKSTLMNLLSGYEKSIVTEIPGTTRDIVEGRVVLGDLILNLSDTAGLRQTDDPIEKIGVERAKSKLENADLILAVFDSSRELDEEDMKLIDFISNKLTVAIINKADLPKKIDDKYILNKIQHTVYISAKTHEGIKELEKVAAEIIGTNQLDLGAGILANERQYQSVNDAEKGLEEALFALESGMTLDAISIGIDEAIGCLSALTGEKASDEIIQRVFEKFCVGK